MLSKGVKETLMRELPDVMDIGSLARYLRVSYRTIYREIENGRLKAKKLLGQWAIRKNDVLKWMSGNSI